jgi:hypothetical protein
VETPQKADHQRAPFGATICCAPGIYELPRPLYPRQGQTLGGYGKAVLLGARRLTRFERLSCNWKTLAIDS